MLLTSALRNAAAGIALTALPVSAWAQAPSNAVQGSAVPAPASAPPSAQIIGFEGGGLGVSGGVTARGPGIITGERSVLHVSLLAETGYDTNVFFSQRDSSATGTAPTSSALFRLTPGVLWTNVPREGPAPSGLAMSVAATFQYRQYLSDDQAVREQQHFSPTFVGSLQYARSPSFSFGVSDAFARVEEAPYVRNSPSIKRDHNVFSPQIGVTPGGGRFRFTLRYVNTLEYFENDEAGANYRYGSNMAHSGLLELSWRWLPKTSLYANVSQSTVTYLDEDPMAPERINSRPLQTLAGIRGLITPKTSANLAAGYSYGFYESGPNPSVVSALASIEYRPQPRLGLLAAYRRDFRNSPLVGSYYYVDGPSVAAQAVVASRLIMMTEGRYEYRRYEGPLTPAATFRRTDHFYVAGAVLDFLIRPWVGLGAGYAFTYNESSASTPGTEGPDYAKHQVFGRLSLTY